MENTPRSKKASFLRPARIFIVLLLGTLFFAAPPQEAPKEKARLQVYPIAVENASAQGCGVCQYFGCVEYIYNEDPEDGSDWTVCVRNGCKAIDGCVPLPPTATIAVSCGALGNNGWCRDSAVAEINVTNSQGQNFIIGGDVNGIAFPCNGTNAPYCSASLPEGTGVVSYMVYTDSGFSVTDSLDYQLDLTTPQIDGNVSGSLGTLDWFVTQAVSSASASDALSGIAALEVTVDGGPWTAIASNQSTVISDGVHTVQYRAYDNAGNYTETPVQEIKVDTAAPTLSVSTTGATGQNPSTGSGTGWYISTVTLTPTASDSISGLASLEVSIDGLPFTNYQSPITLTDGVHSVQFRATDNAGNISQTAPQEIKVDTVTPGLSLSTNGTSGLNGWYVSSVSVTPNASDAGSGINKVEALFDGEAWSIVNGPSSVTDGIHTYQFKVTDNAGNVTATPVQTLKVDTVPPTISAPYVIGLAEDISYQLSDPTSGLNQFSITVADKDNVQPAIGSAWGLTGSEASGAYRWSGQFANDGIATVGLHPYSLRLTDMAGNETVSTGYIEVTRKALIYVGLIVPHNNPPSGSTGAVTYISNPVTSNEIPSVAPAPEAIFGGETVVPPMEGQSTTVAEGGTMPFQGVSIQTGGTSFTSGNQLSPRRHGDATNPQSPISNVLWGSAAAAMLGATLAEWQRRREEEAALIARYAPSGGDGGSDDDEMPEDVRARRRGKVIAKNQARRTQEQAWENARVAQLTQQTQNAILKNKNLTAAETEMGKVNPVTPYVPAGYLDKEEEKWLKEKESQVAQQVQRVQEQNTTSPWETVKDWFREKAEKFVLQPPSWMSVSYQAQPFDTKNLFTDEMIYPQFSARNGFQTWVYQSVSIGIETTSKLTSNPSGWVDINFSNGRITFKGAPDADGRRINYFIQPFSLSAGQISLIPLEDDPKVTQVNVSTYDFDMLGKNWASLKISQAVGLSTSTPLTLPTGETVEKTESVQLQTTASIHRWPRILVVAGVVIYVWEAAGVGVVLKAAASTPLVQQVFQAVSP